jgi:hypothetical protein
MASNGIAQCNQWLERHPDQPHTRRRGVLQRQDHEWSLCCAWRVTLRKQEQGLRFLPWIQIQAEGVLAAALQLSQMVRQ